MSAIINSSTSPFMSVEKGLINKKLPIELFQVALSYLSISDICSALEVCKEWNTAAIQVVRNKDYALINEFVKFVCENINCELYPMQIKRLIDLTNDTVILSSVSLQLVKYNFLDLREKVLIILEELEEIDLEKLENVLNNGKKPPFFRHMLKLAKIYKNIFESKFVDDQTERENTLRFICHELAIIGEINKAANTAYTLQNETIRDESLEIICFLSAQIKKMKKAKEIASTINNDNIRERVLRNISFKLDRLGRFND